MATLPAAMSMPPPQLRGKGLLAGATTPAPAATAPAAALSVPAGEQHHDSDKVLAVKRVFDSIKKIKTSFKSEEAFVEFVQQAYKRKREDAASTDDEAAARRALSAIDAEIEVTKDKLTKLLMSMDDAI